MRKLFLTALLIAMMTMSTTFAAENFSATNTGLKIDTTETPHFVYHAGQHCEATATFPKLLTAREGGALAKLSKEFQSTIKIRYKDRTVNIKSLMMVMGLGIREGSEITIIADGPDAQEAVEVFKEFIENGFRRD